MHQKRVSVGMALRYLFVLGAEINLIFYFFLNHSLEDHRLEEERRVFLLRAGIWE